MDSQNINDNLDGFVGQVIDGEILNSLISHGRIQFPHKPVGSPSAVSQGQGGTKSCDDKQKKDKTDLKSQDESDLLSMIDSVKENEDFVKTLEDMRDDMLAGMNIPAANQQIADAAKQLGSKDGNITKDIWDKAKVITDPNVGEMLSNNFLSPIAAITGNGKIKPPFSECAQLNNEFLDSIDIDLQIDSTNTDNTDEDIDMSDTIADTEQNFADMLKAMFKYLLNELFWNHIWTRMWVSIFDMTMKLVAKPIDTIVLLMMSIFVKPPWYKLSEENYYKYGPVHRIINALKLLFLCKIPRGAWKDYKPEPNIKVFIWGKGVIPLVGLCSDLWENGYDPCNGTENNPEAWENNNASNESIEDDDKGGKADKAFDKFASKMRNMFGGEDKCPRTDLNKAFEDLEDGNEAGAHKCIEAAQIVVKAVINDAVHNNKVGN